VCSSYCNQKRVQKARKTSSGVVCVQNWHPPAEVDFDTCGSEAQVDPSTAAEIDRELARMKQQRKFAEAKQRREFTNFFARKDKQAA
jgi:hypothetical protein